MENSEIINLNGKELEDIYNKITDKIVEETVENEESIESVNIKFKELSIVEIKEKITELNEKFTSLSEEEQQYHIQHNIKELNETAMRQTKTKNHSEAEEKK